MQTVKITLLDGHSFESPMDNIANVKRMLAGQIKDFKIVKEVVKKENPIIEVQEKEADPIKVTRGRPKQVTN